ncbi:unnamed protein product [Thlaspi arvense]|uniref:Uncharacterized protein n=1 Tax=Thlaspi arvense TaxID=13288 RepID=A0AAU9SIL4_THLAR|nr:unnamed protein product [Thlaspi arvense]
MFRMCDSGFKDESRKGTQWSEGEEKPKGLNETCKGNNISSVSRLDISDQNTEDPVGKEHGEKLKKQKKTTEQVTTQMTRDGSTAEMNREESDGATSPDFQDPKLVEVIVGLKDELNLKNLEIAELRRQVESYQGLQTRLQKLDEDVNGYVKHTKHLSFITTLSQQCIKHLLCFPFPSRVMHPCNQLSRHLWPENLHWSFPGEKLEHDDAETVHVTSQSGYPSLSILWWNLCWTLGVFVQPIIKTSVLHERSDQVFVFRPGQNFDLCLEFFFHHTIVSCEFLNRQFRPVIQGCLVDKTKPAAANYISLAEVVGSFQELKYGQVFYFVSTVSKQQHEAYVFLRTWRDFRVRGIGIYLQLGVLRVSWVNPPLGHHHQSKQHQNQTDAKEDPNDKPQNKRFVDLFFTHLCGRDMKWSPVSDQGILPDRLLLDRSSLSKFVRFDNSSGMLPEKLLPKSSRTWRTFSCPTSTGGRLVDKFYALEIDQPSWYFTFQSGSTRTKDLEIWKSIWRKKVLVAWYRFVVKVLCNDESRQLPAALQNAESSRVNPRGEIAGEAVVSEVQNVEALKTGKV